MPLKQKYMCNTTQWIEYGESWLLLLWLKTLSISLSPTNNFIAYYFLFICYCSWLLAFLPFLFNIMNSTSSRSNHFVYLLQTNITYSIFCCLSWIFLLRFPFLFHFTHSLAHFILVSFIRRKRNLFSLVLKY